ncbi:hypothetical protein KDK88_04590 [bacterium]|nr:hypothetical protein [bacterium]HPF34901.1 hypothetical protein [Candidatus Krumholzibacteria bacterium]HRX50980.1 hypothetical protein [Candidatus Krumholzibacteria bacterium]
MADAGKRWILGCGLAGGLVALAIVVTGVGATLKLRTALEPVKQAQESWEVLTAAHGRVADYVPPADGAVPPGRLQVYLAARERLFASRAELDALFAAPPTSDDASFLSGLMASFGRVSAVVGPVARAADLRHRVLADAGMGPGEYAWITALAYVGWLGMDPATVPRRADGSVVFDAEDGFVSPAAVRHRYESTLATLLDNATIGAGAALGLEHADAEFWRRASARLEAGGDPWAEGVPSAAAVALQPFRDRLLALWDPQLAALEWPMGDDWDWGRVENHH